MLNTQIAAFNSNSYVSIEEADNYFNSHVDGDKWLDLSLQEQEKFLIHSTRLIDNYKKYSFPKYSIQQSLQFPRKNHIQNNLPYIPIDIKNATCEQALFLIVNEDGWVNRMLYDNGLTGYSNGVETFNFREQPNLICFEAKQYLNSYVAKIRW